MTLQLGLGPLRTFAAAVGVAALIGCGGSDETAKETATPAATKAQAAVPDDLVGTWTRRIAARASTYVAAGLFTMKVLPDGSVEMYDPDANPKAECTSQQYCEQLRLTARDGKLIISATTYCGSSAEYSYKITGDKLVTDRVKDRCSQDRPQLFDGATWRRQS